MTEITHPLLKPFADLPVDARPSQDEAMEHVHSQLRMNAARVYGLGPNDSHTVPVMLLAALHASFGIVGAKAPSLGQLAMVPDSQVLEVWRPDEDVKAENDVIDGEDGDFR